jgi:hypothetical protein
MNFIALANHCSGSAGAFASIQKGQDYDGTCYGTFEDQKSKYEQYIVLFNINLTITL